MARSINEAGLELIERFEGFCSEPYLCPAGCLTIGFGHRIRQEEFNFPISLAQARQLLALDLARYESAVERAVTVPLNDNQFAALVSFCFNVGVRAFRRSTLLKKLNCSDYQGAADELLRWNKAGGKVLPGLTARRRAERKLFLKEEDNVQGPGNQRAPEAPAHDRGPAFARHQGDGGEPDPAMVRQGARNREPLGRLGGRVLRHPHGHRAGGSWLAEVMKATGQVLWGWLSGRRLRSTCPCLPDQDGSGVTRLDGEKGWDDEDNRYRYPGEHPDGA